MIYSTSPSRQKSPPHAPILLHPPSQLIQYIPPYQPASITPSRYILNSSPPQLALLPTPLSNLRSSTSLQVIHASSAQKGLQFYNQLAMFNATVNSTEYILKEDTYTGEGDLHDNIIRETRKIIRNMSETQKFEKAKAHIMDSIGYKHPRPESEALNTPLLFKFVYFVQSSSVWEWLLFFLGYVFMYLVIMDNQSYAAKISIQATILLLFWLDNIMVYYCKLFDNFKRKNKLSKFYYAKVFLILLMTIDLVIFIALPCYDSRPIRPFRILRAFVPLLFDPELRKSLFALASAYKDVLVYLIFFSFIICAWALIGSRALTFDPNYVDPNYPQSRMDPYKNNYSNLGDMIFVVYVTATYDSYPDNQIVAIQNYEPNYIYFIVFIFLNMFLFSSIPGSLIYMKFRETRSKIILLDEIRQQHSLILAFVTLAEDQKNLTVNKLIKFLLYLYKFKIRYIEYITDICLRLDDNNNKSIQVNEFMQLSKILLENSAMLPPAFEDIQTWIAFRHWCNTRLHLKHIVRHWIFELIVSIIIILSFINAIFLMFFNSSLALTFDAIFVWVFLAELLIRILAIGPQNFFNDRWNNVDTLLVVFGIAFFFIPDTTGADSVVRMSRIFRIASLIRLISHSNFLKNVRLQIFDKIKNIFTIILEIMPIILKFFPLFLFFFYIFAIFGMEVFYNSYETNGSSAYNQYQQFSSFRTFIQAQYIMVQVLTEAGWSQLAFDHSWRNAPYFGYVMVYFCFMHITITYIVATLIRGIFWEVFFTVNSIYSERNRENNLEEIKEEEFVKKTQELNEINDMIAENQYIDPNTVLKRNLVENKLDLEIFKKLKAAYESEARITTHRHHTHHQRSKRSIMVEKMMDDWHIDIKELEISEDVKSKYKEKSEKSNNSKGERKRKMSLNDIEEVDEEDIESEIEELLDVMIINPKILFTEVVAYPKIFVDFLNSKFKKPESFIREHDFDLRLNPLYNQQSMFYHIYEIHALLGIQTSKREQKAMIIETLYEDNIITEQTVEKLIKKKLQEKVFHVDTNGTLRRLFLSETNEELIKKFQVEYFSDLYGYSFRHINKMTLEPLLRFQATLTYSLRNILRYPQINNTQFFEMFTHIEDQLSNKLLKRGSLFKFVYKIDHESDIWFSIEYKQQQEMRIHFVKTGIWAYTKEMVDGQTYYAADAFNWKLVDRPDRKACEQYVKRFYQSFEGLAFSLLDENEFFRANPASHIYDLYVQTIDVQKVSRFVTRRLEVSKIMVVVLSKEEERADIGASELVYPISDIVGGMPTTKKHTDFSFDETDNETYEKLKNIAAMDVERIVESEGLPFSYIVNLMHEINDIVSLYGKNFLFQIEKVLNDQYETINEENKEEEGNAFNSISLKVYD